MNGTRVVTHELRWRLAEDLIGARSGLARRVAARRVAYRAHLAATVDSATPLLAALVGGGELAEALSRLWPPRGWMTSSGGEAGFDAWRTRRPKGSQPLFGRIDAEGRVWRDVFRRSGVSLREPSDPEGGLGLKVLGRSVELALWSWSTRLSTAAGIVRIEADGVVPETVAVAALGRDLDDLLSHPFTAGRGYRIASVRNLDGRVVSRR